MALLDQEEKVEREEDRIAQEYLDAGNGQLQLLPPQPVSPLPSQAADPTSLKVAEIE